LWENVLIGKLINADLVKKFLSSLLNVMYYYQEPMKENQRLFWNPELHDRVKDSPPLDPKWFR
jgi:hypothetical protein